MNEVIVSQTGSPPQVSDEVRYRALLFGSQVPDHLHDGLVEYLAHHRRPGSYLYAVLSNDLLMAVKRGDDVSRASLSGLVIWLHDYAPIPTWGSPEKVATWLSGNGKAS